MEGHEAWSVVLKLKTGIIYHQVLVEMDIFPQNAAIFWVAIRIDEDNAKLCNLIGKDLII